jgi:tetratricopeptide (TPR) repeat protein
MFRPAFLVLVCLAVAHAAERTDPVADLVRAADTLVPAEVIARVDSWTGTPPAILRLIRARARWQLAVAATGAERARRLTGADDDAAAALAADPTLVAAHRLRAQVAAERGDWRAASRHGAAGIDPARDDADTLAWLADTALRAGDRRLATLAAQHGILRFPDDPRLRRSELTVLAHAGRAADARQAALALADQDPADATVWRHLAWSARELGDDAEADAALTAALAVTPQDRALRAQVVAGLLRRGHGDEALERIRPAMDGDGPVDESTALLAAQAAQAAGELALAGDWLARSATRSRTVELAAARLAVARQDPVGADRALDRLVQASERDPQILTWAGSLAEQIGDPARAEACYLAAGTHGPATLRLAVLYLRQGRRDEARTTLAAHLAAHPDDRQARELLDRWRP